jgi:hypothetical protein
MALIVNQTNWSPTLGIDLYLKAEKDLQDKMNNNKSSEKELTYDYALSRYLILKIIQI